MDLARVTQATHFSSSYLSSPLGPKASIGLVLSHVWNRAKVPVDTQQLAHSCCAASAQIPLVPCPGLAGERAEGVDGTVQADGKMKMECLEQLVCPTLMLYVPSVLMGEIFYLGRWKASSMPPVLWAQVWGPTFL